MILGAIAISTVLIGYGLYRLRIEKQKLKDTEDYLKNLQDKDK